MPALLAVTASPRGEYSLSNALAQTFIHAFQQAHPGAAVVTRDLQQTTLPFVDVPWMTGAYTPPETHSPEVKKSLEIGNTLIAEIQAADHIVLGTPMYNFSTPAVLKAWIDHIVRVNVTFTRDYQGLIQGKKVTVILASAGVYTPESGRQAQDFETGYLKFILGFIGITDVTFIHAGGTAALNTGAKTLQDLVAQYTPEVEAAARA